MGNRFVATISYLILSHTHPPSFSLARECWEILLEECAVKYHSWDIKAEIFFPRASTVHHPQTMPHYLCIPIKGKLPWNSDMSCQIGYLPALSVHPLKNLTWNSFSPSFPIRDPCLSFLSKVHSSRKGSTPVHIEHGFFPHWLITPHCELVKKIKVLGWSRVVQYCFFQNGIKYSSEPELANSRVEGGEQEYQSIHEGAGEWDGTHPPKVWQCSYEPS